jgi:hypothetical protein
LLGREEIGHDHLVLPASGAVEANGVRIDARDGAAIKDTGVVKIAHSDVVKIMALQDSELVLVDTP